MRIGLAQINSHLGNFAANCKKIIDFTKRAKERRCDIVIFPEAALFGYHPMDILKRKSVVEEQLKYLRKIKQAIPKDIAVVVGAFTKNKAKTGKPYFNTAFVLQKGKKDWSCNKELLPTYDIFDDARHIEPGDLSKNIFKFKNKKILITICEDIWAWPVKNQVPISYYATNPIKKIKPGTVDLILNLSASPYFDGKIEKREYVVRSTARYLKAPMAYVNIVGGQDELIFDGGSLAVDKMGRCIAQSFHFQEDINVLDLNDLKGEKRAIETDAVELMRRALVLGLQDFVLKTGQRKLHLGLSGGIDSAVVACIAVDAVGSANVAGYALPGPFSSDISLDLAKKLASGLNIQFSDFSITETYKILIKQMEEKMGPLPFGLTHENLQARLRGIVLMMLSNKENSLLLNTTNKTEMASGYGTLYGDLIGALAPIGDLLKRDVYALAKHYNMQYEIIPEKIITRSPSAELRKNQKDSDSLPDYDTLDDAVVSIVEQMKPAKTKVEKFLLDALMKNEFKRWQSPPILKVRESSFGQGRRMPIAHRGWY